MLFPPFSSCIVLARVLVFNSLGNIPKSGIAGPCGSSMFNFLRNCQTIFCGSCTILYSYQHCTRVCQFIFNEEHNMMGKVKRKYVWPSSLLELCISDFA